MFLGGTVDIAAMKVESDKTISQLHFAEGGAHGGILVNENYYKFLEELVGTEEMKVFKRDNTTAAEALLQVLFSMPLVCRCLK